MAMAIVGTLACGREFAIINTGAIVEHDNDVGEAAHIAPGVVLAGRVRVGDRALVGAGTAVRPYILIGNDAVVGAGSAVVANVLAASVVAGTPAKVLRARLRLLLVPFAYPARDSQEVRARFTLTLG